MANPVYEESPAKRVAALEEKLGYLQGKDREAEIRPSPVLAQVHSIAKSCDLLGKDVEELHARLDRVLSRNRPETASTGKEVAAHAWCPLAMQLEESADRLHSVHAALQELLERVEL